MVGMTMIRRVAPLLSRPLSTTQIRNGSRIPKSSPPLVSLDLPDEWSSNFTHSDSPPPPPKYTDNATARIIDGISEAEQIRASIAVEVSRMKESTGKVPGLAVVLVGQRQDSLVYVRKKLMACHEVGFRFFHLLNSLRAVQKRRSVMHYQIITKMHQFMVFLCSFL